MAKDETGPMLTRRRSNRLRESPVALALACALTLAALAVFNGSAFGQQPILCGGFEVTIDLNTNGAVGIGTENADVILGTAGADIIDGRGGSDIVCGHGGDDTLSGGEGDDLLFGAAGDDILRGGPGNDALSGGPGADRVLGGTGEDHLDGGDGDDFLGGLGGADHIDGGAGADTIFGGYGADTIDGGDGPDTIFGLIGDDSISGGAGDDVINGDKGNDVIGGDDGNDVLNGGNAVDTISGDSGDDILGGGKADDTLEGGDGADTCAGNMHELVDVALGCETIFCAPSEVFVVYPENRSTCSSRPLVTCAEFGTAPNARIAKWPQDRSGAVSVNYDAGVVQGQHHDAVRRIVEDHGLRIDYELVTGNIADAKASFIRQDLIPRGYDFFGHGREHLSHDAQGAAWSLESAEHTRDTMIGLGLRPVAFAYPRGAGFEPAVQDAIENAGFLSARMFAGSDPFIVPGDTTAPDNWFALPVVRMESIEFEGNRHLINNTGELIPLLDDNIGRGSWLILVYHSIGSPDGWGYYELADFESDMQAIAERDLWVASLNDATLYVREFETAVLKIDATFDDTNGCHGRAAISVEDGRDDTRFDMPLSVVLTVPKSWYGQKGSLACPGAASIDLTFASNPSIFSLLPDGVPCVAELAIDP